QFHRFEAHPTVLLELFSINLIHLNWHEVDNPYWKQNTRPAITSAHLTRTKDPVIQRSFVLNLPKHDLNFGHYQDSEATGFHQFELWTERSQKLNYFLHRSCEINSNQNPSETLFQVQSSFSPTENPESAWCECPHCRASLTWPEDYRSECKSVRFLSKYRC